MALLLLSLSSNASPVSLKEEIARNGIDQNQHDSYYQVLGEAFKKGMPLTKDFFDGFLWSGRCFDENNRNTPRNGAFHSLYPRGPFASIAVNFRSEDANYFDFKDVDDLEIDRSWYSKMYKGEGNELMVKRKYAIDKFKRMGNYIIGEFVSVENTNDGPLNWKYTVNSRCYYFSTRDIHNL